MKRPVLTRWFRRLLPFVALLILLLLSHAVWLAALARYLVVAEPPVRADIVLILAGDFTGQRMLAGADLVKRGFAPKALVSGPSGLFGEYESEFAIAFAVRRGYPKSYFIPVPNNSKSTEQEARAIIPELRKLGVHSVDIVTANFHTRRARRVYRAQAPDLEIHMVAATDDSFQPKSWWHDRESRKIFLSEWTKTVANWLGM